MFTSKIYIKIDLSITNRYEHSTQILSKHHNKFWQTQMSIQKFCMKTMVFCNGNDIESYVHSRCSLFKVHSSQFYFDAWQSSSAML